MSESEADRIHTYLEISETEENVDADYKIHVIGAGYNYILFLYESELYHFQEAVNEFVEGLEDA